MTSGDVPADALDNAIKNQNTLQSGSTFYTSSGSVSGSITAGSVVSPLGTLGALTTKGLTILALGSGNVGIGTDETTSFFHIKSGLQTTMIVEQAVNSTIGDNPNIWVNAGGSAGNIGQFGFGYNPAGDGTAFVPSVVGFKVDDQAGNTFGDLFFATRDTTADAAPKERMTLKGNGNFGIGTTSPSATLHVSSIPASVTAAIFKINTDTMTVLANGNVGMGDATPSFMLEVSSDVKFAGPALGPSGSILCVRGNGTLGYCSGTVGDTCTCN